MAKEKTEKDAVKTEVEKEVSSADELKVVDESLASDKTTTVPGIYEGKKPKFGKEKHGV